MSRPTRVVAATATDAVRAALVAAEARCLTAGERWTTPRARVLQLLLEAAGPVRAYELVSAFSPGAYTHPPTVYRALDFLTANGLAHHLETENRYVACARPGAPHDAQFLICEACSHIDEYPFSPPRNVTAAADAFLVRRWVVELRGLCPACAGPGEADPVTRDPAAR